MLLLELYENNQIQFLCLFAGVIMVGEVSCVMSAFHIQAVQREPVMNHGNATAGKAGVVSSVIKVSFIIIQRRFVTG